MAERKSFLLRIPAELYDQVATWAEQDLRSMNGQIEWLLKEAVTRRRRGASEPPNEGEDPAR